MSESSYGITLPALGLGAVDQLEFARAAERHGYSSLGLVEASFIDSFTLGGALIEATDLPVMTSIVPVYNRTPMVLAMSAATASILSGGRFTLGLGSSSEAILGWNGVPLEKPLTRMRETVGVVRRLLDGEKVDYEGETLRLSRAALEEAPPTRVPIYLGALNRRMLRLAGELADGIIVAYMLPDQLPILIEELHAGARRVGRDPEEIDVVVRLAVLPGIDREQGRDFARRKFGPYAAQAGYNKYFRAIGFGAEAEAVAAAYASRDRAGTQGAISDSMADAFVVAGSAEECHRRIGEFLAAGATSISVWPQSAATEEAFEHLQAMAPAGMPVQG